MQNYAVQLKSVLSPAETALFKRLSSANKIQDFLDEMPINFEYQGDTIYSPRQVVAQGKAHCIEGALLAAVVLAYHGQRPLLLDLQTLPYDDDHVVALFKENGYWGAISKTNHAILRWRDPVYKTVRELAMSFFHEYYMNDGVKTLRAFSRPFDLRRYAPGDWVVSEAPLERIAEELDDSPHFPILQGITKKSLRKASLAECKILDVVEWESEKKKLL
ncbi:MAG: hypothetical protein NT019_03085 [Candidatus Adlerbacteria bacterium]|nr:hypothetical protein [Candidatus Adlerbacteria bacterium]